MAVEEPGSQVVWFWPQKMRCGEEALFARPPTEVERSSPGGSVVGHGEAGEGRRVADSPSGIFCAYA